MRRGTFIAIEGVDKLANISQLELLAERLEKDGQQVLCLNFSELKEPAGHYVKQYLDGKFGTQNDVGPYASSMFFAMNRYHAAEEIRQALDDGKVVLATDFTGASMAQQGSTLASIEERRGFYIWLDNMDYQMLKLPRPDKTFILRMPVEGLSGQFKSLASTYDDLPQLFPKDFTRLDYVRSGKSMDIKQLHDYIWKFTEPLLPKVKQPEKPLNAIVQPSSVFIPEELTGKTKQTYTDILGQILELRRQIGDSLVASNMSKADQSEVLESLLPVAAYTSPTEHHQAIALAESPKAEKLKLASTKTKDTYANMAKDLDLHTVLPRNELDILPNMLYPASNLPINQLKKQINNSKYEQKAKLFEQACLADGKNTALQHLNYGFELLISIYSLRTIHSVSDSVVSAQAYSPRYGYDVSEDLDDKLLEQYEHAFDLSLKLYSNLQEAGLESLAQLAVLRGHKTRVILDIDGAALTNLLKTTSQRNIHPSTKALGQHILDATKQVHPLASECYEQFLGN